MSDMGMVGTAAVWMAWLYFRGAELIGELIESVAGKQNGGR